jgi:GTP cyclohydrolase I
MKPAPDLDAAADAIERFLVALGHPAASNPELAGTGKRVADAFANELLIGYASDPAEILADTTGTSAPGLVVLTGIETTAICPHHLLPSSGVVHVGYLPSERVVGLGALARLVDCHARRLVLQEDLAQSIVDSLVQHLGAKAAGAVVSLRPSCVTARGSRQHGVIATTMAFAGEVGTTFRQELLASVPRP